LKCKQCLFQSSHIWNSTLKQTAKTAVKRFNCFIHAVLHMNSAYCWNVSVSFHVLYHGWNKTISSVRNGICFTVVFQFYFSCEDTIRYRGQKKSANAQSSIYLADFSPPGSSLATCLTYQREEIRREERRPLSVYRADPDVADGERDFERRSTHSTELGNRCGWFANRSLAVTTSRTAVCQRVAYICAKNGATSLIKRNMTPFPAYRKWLKAFQHFSTRR